MTGCVTGPALCASGPGSPQILTRHHRTFLLRLHPPAPAYYPEDSPIEIKKIKINSLIGVITQVGYYAWLLLRFIQKSKISVHSIDSVSDPVICLANTTIQMLKYEVKPRQFPLAYLFKSSPLCSSILEPCFHLKNRVSNLSQSKITSIKRQYFIDLCSNRLHYTF